MVEAMIAAIPQIPAVDQYVDRLLPQLQQSEDGVWFIKGRATAGKSAALHRIARRIRSDTDLVPILVSPPVDHLDAGAIALMDIAVALDKANLLPSSLEEFAANKASWGEKHGEVATWLEQAVVADRIVLLCDEPDLWSHAADPKDASIRDHGQDVADLLRRVRCRRIETSQHEGTGNNVHSLRTRPGAVGRWTANSAVWGGDPSLAACAAELFEQYEHQIAGRSLLEIRLLVGLQALGAKAEISRSLQGPATTSQRAIAQSLFDVLGRSKHGRTTREIWKRLVLLRGSFRTEFLSAAGFNKLPANYQAIVKACLLYRSDNGDFVLHDTLRKVQDVGLIPRARQRFHRLFANTYKKRFESESGTSEALRLEMEAFHHWSQSGSEDMGLRAFFGDQLDALGKSLSLQARARREDAAREVLFGQAVECFRDAIKWDAEDDYAHHYLAYNLDVQGLAPNEVEEHYIRAIELAPHRVWWHSRYICFLVTLAREGDAQLAWDDALLSLPDFREDESVLRELHSHVARLALRRGWLDFAASVLNDVPSDQPSEGRLAILQRQLRALQDVQDHGAFVPIDRQGANWRNEPPVLLPGQIDNLTLRQWWAARVSKIDEHKIYLDACEVDGNKSQYGTISLPRVRFEEDSNIRVAELAVGRFLEVGKYTGDGPASTLVRVHQTRNAPLTLGEIYPDPQRYIRRSAA